MKFGSDRIVRKPRTIPARAQDAKPCPTCYAPLERVRGGWVCTGKGQHQLALKQAA